MVMIDGDGGDGDIGDVSNDDGVDDNGDNCQTMQQWINQITKNSLTYSWC